MNRFLTKASLPRLWLATVIATLSACQSTSQDAPATTPQVVSVTIRDGKIVDGPAGTAGSSVQVVNGRTGDANAFEQIFGDTTAFEQIFSKQWSVQTFDVLEKSGYGMAGWRNAFFKIYVGTLQSPCGKPASMRTIEPKGSITENGPEWEVWTIDLCGAAKQYKVSYGVPQMKVETQ